MARNVRLTMVTIHNKLRPLAERRAETLEMIERAGKEGSDIVLLPEMADHHRTHEAVAAHEKGKDAVREELALTFESPWMREVIGFAKKYKMVVIPCIARRDGDKVFNSAVVFGPDGKLLGKYDKSHLAPGEETKFDWGQSLEPIATPFGKVGIFTCWDIYFPEITRVYQLKGAEILLWTTMPHGGYARDIYASLLPSRCVISGLPMGVSTFAVDNQLEQRLCMNSVIYDGHGEIVAGGRRAGNALVKGVVDLDDASKVPADWGLPETMTFAQLLKAHRRPELYGALTEKKR